MPTIPYTQSAAHQSGFRRKSWKDEVGWYSVRAARKLVTSPLLACRKWSPSFRPVGGPVSPSSRHSQIGAELHSSTGLVEGEETWMQSKRRGSGQHLSWKRQAWRGWFWGLHSEVWDSVLRLVGAAEHFMDTVLSVKLQKLLLCQMLVEKVGSISMFYNSRPQGPVRPSQSIR